MHLADGHGGIQSLAKTGTSGLEDTYTITYADTTTSTFTVTNGKGIDSITKTPAVAPSLTDSYRVTYTDGTTYDFTVDNGKGIDSITWTSSGTPGDGQVHTGTITYNDGTTDTIVFTDGLKGDTGDPYFVHIKYASEQPTSDNDMGDVPDDWMGVYSGTSETAPTHYTDYAWHQIKGATGDTGAAAAIENPTVEYMESSSGTVAPSGSWTTTIPSVTPGNFLWTRTTLPFNDGTTIVSYSVARFGIDGTGAVSSVNNVSPDPNGNISLGADDIAAGDNQSVQQHLEDIEDALDVFNLKTYTTVAQLGLTAGSATLAEAYAALPNGSILITTGNAFGGAAPSNSTVIIGKSNAGSWRGYVHAYVRDGSIYTMGINSSTEAPTGTWTKMVSAAYMEDYLVRETVTDTVTINANGESGDKTLSIAKTGYVPIGVVGKQITGTASQNGNMFRCAINGAGTGVYYRIRNNHTAEVTWTLSFQVLWIKSS